MARSKMLVTLLVVLGVCTLAGTRAFAAPAKCDFTGNYSFFFWDPDDNLSGVGYFSLLGNTAEACRGGVVVAGGIINCNLDTAIEYEDYIEGGTVSVESDGQGTILLETNSSSGICDTGDTALELDVSVVKKGQTILFSSNAVEEVASGTVSNAGNDYTITGRAEKCYYPAPPATDITGCYDIRFWENSEELVGDCSICVGGGYVLGATTCHCNYDLVEYESEIETGGYVEGEDCESSTGFLEFEVSSGPLCGIADAGTVYLDYVVAEKGAAIMGACDSFNAFNCSFEGWAM